MTGRDQLTLTRKNAFLECPEISDKDFLRNFAALKFQSKIVMKHFRKKFQKTPLLEATIKIIQFKKTEIFQLSR